MPLLRASEQAYENGGCVSPLGSGCGFAFEEDDLIFCSSNQIFTSVYGEAEADEWSSLREMFDD